MGRSSGKGLLVEAPSASSLHFASRELSSFSVTSTDETPELSPFEFVQLCIFDVSAFEAGRARGTESVPDEIPFDAVTEPFSSLCLLRSSGSGERKNKNVQTFFLRACSSKP